MGREELERQLAARLQIVERVAPFSSSLGSIWDPGQDPGTEGEGRKLAPTPYTWAWTGCSPAGSAPGSLARLLTSDLPEKQGGQGGLWGPGWGCGRCTRQRVHSPALGCLLCFLGDRDPGIRALGLPRPRFTSCLCCLGAP